MLHMPKVTSTERFEKVSSFLKENSPFVISRFWGMVKRNNTLDAMHWDSCHGSNEQREVADSILLNSLMEFAAENLPADLVEEMECSLRDYVVWCEVAQASQEEPDVEAAIWEVWEAQDRQAEIDAQYTRWRNEY